MRSLWTLMLAIVFVAAFVSFFLVGAIASYARDTSAVLGSARRAQAREQVVALVAATLHAELAADPRLAGIAEVPLRVAVDRVIDETWFEKTLAGAHRSVLAAIEGAEGDAIVELRATKAKLQAALAELGQRARSECESFFGRDACGDSLHLEQAMLAYRARADAAVRQLPDRIDLLGQLEDRAPVRLQELRRRVADAEAIRWLGLGVLVVTLGLIAFLSATSGSRLLVTIGAVVAVAAALYLAVVALAAAPIRERALAYATELGAAGPEPRDEVGRQARVASQRLGLVLIEDATKHRHGSVLAMGVAGLGLVAAGRWLARGR